MNRQIIDFESENQRLDVVLGMLYPDVSRSRFQKLITEGHVKVNGATVKPSYKCSIDDEVDIDFPEAKSVEIIPEDIPLSILYEDDDVLVVDKPKNMVVHPAFGHYTGTLVNAVMYHCKDSLSGINGELRPGIVHRIDKDTTGSLVICKNDAAHVDLAEQIKVHSVNRTYRGILIGHHIPTEGVVDRPIGRDEKDRKKMAINEKHGKNAITHYRILKEADGYAYAEFKLETGRTHQIRVHMASIGYPLLGDPLYGSKKCPYHLEGQCLHAYTLGFVHPTTKEYMEFTA
ncbi:MAG: RluA family pseudouridine synthase, partial [Lachnospiraceae bacterium]|nr:RluA family pseudouridine synthase [Lachnospiraceae bacterium]